MGEEEWPMMEGPMTYAEADADSQMSPEDEERHRAHVRKVAYEHGWPLPDWEPTIKMRKMRVDGLTDEEGVVMDSLIRAVEAFAKLPEQHPSEINEFIAGIHKCQDLMAVRIARRLFPDGWPQK